MKGEKQSETKEESKAECIICKNELKKGAIKCVQCGSFQHRWRRILAGIDLKSLVALVPILTLSFVFVKDQLVDHKSDLRIAALSCSDGESIRIAVSNLGDRPAVIREKVKYHIIVNGKEDEAKFMVLKTPNLQLIKPGEHIISDLIAWTGANTDAPIVKCPPGSACEYKIIFSIIGFDHKPYSLQVPCNPSL